MKLSVYNQTGDKVEEENIQLPKSSRVDIKKVILARLANQRQATASAKSRGQVSGSSKKPWRQKGTGRARAGTKKSPLWIGGGVVFPPHPGRKTKKINKKENKLARQILLAQKIKDGDVALIKNFKFDKPNTKAIAKLLTKINLASQKILLIQSQLDNTLRLSCRNIANLNYKLASDINLLDLAKHQKIIVTKAALKKLL